MLSLTTSFLLGMQIINHEQWSDKEKSAIHSNVINRNKHCWTITCSLGNAIQKDQKTKENKIVDVNLMFHSETWKLQSQFVVFVQFPVHVSYLLPMSDLSF